VALWQKLGGLPAGRFRSPVDLNSTAVYIQEFEAALLVTLR
jgi:hypothetical protein